MVAVPTARPSIGRDLPDRCLPLDLMPMNGPSLHSPATVPTLVLPVITVLFLALLGSSLPGAAMPLAAQSTVGSGDQAVLADLPSGTRALALGGAFHGGLRESDAIFASPGHLTNPSGMEAAFQGFGSGGSLVQMSAGTDWWSGGVALGVRALGYGPALRRADPGSSGSRGAVGLDWLTDDVSELHLTAGYGRVVRGFRMGAAGSVLQFRTSGRGETTGAASLGLARSVGPITLSAAALNLGGGLATPPAAGDVDLDDLTPTALSLRREVALGAASQSLPVGPLDLTGAARIGLGEERSLAWGGGLELSYWPVQGRTFSVRIGGRSPHEGSSEGRWTLGGGFRGDRLGLDYALMPFEGASASHRIGLSFR